jgi:hypothetical protein
MLSRPRKAHHTSDQRVVATVSSPIGLGEQFIETMGWLLSPTPRDVDPDCLQSRRGHCHQQRRLALLTCREIVKSRADELVARGSSSTSNMPLILGEMPYAVSHLPLS